MLDMKWGQKIKDKTGMRSSNTAELVFNQCLIPHSHLISQGPESLAGMMRNLEIERLSLSAMSLGIARRCLTEMNRYASERVTFKVPIRNHGANSKISGSKLCRIHGLAAIMFITLPIVLQLKRGQAKDQL